MKLSLCIATFNEQQNIHYPLDSAYDLVDEVIIVDGGSIDKTIEIAKSYGKKVKVFIEENPKMFHINKQKAIERAKGEWILQLDADEALSDGLKDEIKKLIHRNFQFPSSNFQTNPKFKIQKSVTGVPSQGSQQRGEFFQPVAGSSTGGKDEGQAQSQTKVAFWIPRKNFFLSRFLMKGGQYPDYTIRLYRNGYARFPCKSVHENVEIKIPNSQYPISNKISNLKFKNSKFIRNWKLEIGYLKNPILHYADPDFSRYLQRWDRYTSLEAEQLKKNIQYPISNIQHLLMFINYLIIKPIIWFFKMYFRHLGFLDGFPGFVFALFSSIRFWVIYIKFWQNVFRKA